MPVAMISAVVVGRNRKDKLGRCLQSLHRSIHPVDEIIYVDTGSEEDLCSYVRETFPRVTTLNAPGGNAQRARNLGAARSSGNWLLFCDDDVELSPDAIPSMLDKGEASPSIGMIGCRTHYLGKRGGRRFASYCMMSPIWFPREGYLDAWKGCLRVYSVRNLYFVRRDAFDATGGWDEDFFIEGDEVDLSYRLYRAGYTVICDAGATILDLNEWRGQARATRARIPEAGASRAELSKRNMILAAMKNLALPLLVLFLPGMATYLAVDSAVKGELGDLARAWRSFFKAIPLIRRKRLEQGPKSPLSDLRLYLSLQRERALNEGGN